MNKKIEKLLDKVNTTFNKVEDQVKKYSEGPKKFITQSMEFLKKHKKLLITVGIVYVIFDYLFGEETKEKDEN